MLIYLFLVALSLSPAPPKVARTFTVAVMADSHLIPRAANPDPVERQRSLDLYAQTCANVAADCPDLLIDLGDTFHPESPRLPGDAESYAEVEARYLMQRPYLDTARAGAPLWLVLGNHEAEQGWRIAAGDPLPAWGLAARMTHYPNPGSAPEQNYYAVEVEEADALFVVLDPYRYTMECPQGQYPDYPASSDAWDWTLGETQYNFLADALAQSQASLRFVFIHQIVGGKTVSPSGYYGRGGIEYAAFYEWGGHDESGEYTWAAHRPGWSMPIHQLLVAGNVSAVFRGHDHAYACQELDGIIYQLVPRPIDANYSTGMTDEGGYVLGTILRNSGHIRLTIQATGAHVEYVRAFLPGEGENRDVADEYSLCRSGPHLSHVPAAPVGERAYR